MIAVDWKANCLHSICDIFRWLWTVPANEIDSASLNKTTREEGDAVQGFFLLFCFFSWTLSQNRSEIAIVLNNHFAFSQKILFFSFTWSNVSAKPFKTLITAAQHCFHSNHLQSTRRNFKITFTAAAVTLEIFWDSDLFRFLKQSHCLCFWICGVKFFNRFGCQIASKTLVSRWGQPLIIAFIYTRCYLRSCQWYKLWAKHCRSQ